MSGNWELKQRLDQFRESTTAMRIDSRDQTTAEWGWSYYFNFQDWMTMRGFPREDVSWAKTELGTLFQGFGRRFDKGVWARAKSSSLRCRRIMAG